MAFTVYLPAGTPDFALDSGDINVVHYESSEQLAGLLASNGNDPVVIMTGDLSSEDQEIVAAAIREHSLRAVEVRAERWDGFSASPLSAACRGVIAGFGANGIPAAIAVQRQL